MENISSEQELKELFEEGKISQEEYEQLLEAMRKKPKPPTQPINSAPTKSKAKHGLGIIAFFLMLAGIIATVLGFVLIFIGMVPRMGMLLVLLVFAAEVLALILGIFAFSSGWGKAATICAPCYSFLVLPVVILVVIFVAAQPRVIEVVEEPQAIVCHKAWPLDSLEGLLTRSNVKLDSNVSADGNGSLKIQSQEAGTIRLFETGPISVQNRLLFYSAKVRSAELQGKAFLEMWCNIPGQGEFFSRGLDQPVSGTTEWTNVQTPFRLEAGQMPGNVKLNIVIEGSGTVWIDDIKLLSAPLN